MTIDDAIIADVVDGDDIAEDNKNETTAKKEKKNDLFSQLLYTSSECLCLFLSCN